MSVERGVLVVDWTPTGFEPSVDRGHHAHFFLTDMRPTQAGSNAAKFGVKGGFWSAIEAQPFVDRDNDLRIDTPRTNIVEFPQVGKVLGICVTVGVAPSHAAENPDVYDCAPIPVE